VFLFKKIMEVLKKCCRLLSVDTDSFSSMTQRMADTRLFVEKKHSHRLRDRGTGKNFVSGVVAYPRKSHDSPHVRSIRKVFFLCVLLCTTPILAEPSHEALQTSLGTSRPTSNFPFRHVETRPIQSPQALLFVSFSIPKEHFMRLLQQAKALHVPLVLNGVLNHNLNQTLAKIFEFNQKIKANLLIDPRLFKTFHITRVPTLVVLTSSSTFQSIQKNPPEFDVIRGDMSLRSMLKAIAVHGDVGKATAQRLLEEETR